MVNSSGMQSGDTTSTILEDICIKAMDGEENELTGLLDVLEAERSWPKVARSNITIYLTIQHNTKLPQ